MRIRSLNKDKKDFDQLRNHRMAHMGFSVSNEFYQPVPFFYTREGAQMNMIGHYRGASAFMICNGPSLVNGKFNLNLLKHPGIITYGINNGPRTIRPNFWTCVDDPKRFLKSIWFDPQICKIVPHSFAEKRMFDNEQWAEMDMVVGQCPNVIYFHRNEKFVAERFLFEDTINWGNSGDNGGGRSVMLPTLRILFLLGFRKVYLLGADFKMSETYTYHFDEQRHKGAVNGNMNTYEKLKNEYFPALKPYFDAEGFNVYNCNPDSELKVFDFVPFEDAIKEACSNLGDIQNERTWGMYSKPDERPKWKNEPPEQMKAHLTNIRNRPMAPVFGNNEQNDCGEGNHDNNDNNEEIRRTIELIRPTVTKPVSVFERVQIPPRKPIQDQHLQRPQQFQQPQQSQPPQQTRPIQTQSIKPQQQNTNIIVPNKSTRIIRNIPCGAITFGSSRNNTQSNNPIANITIKDDGR